MIFELFRKLSEGHPDEKDIQKAEKFIDNMIKSI